jgi:hypothetical protein
VVSAEVVDLGWCRCIFPWWVARLLYACSCNPEDVEVQRCYFRCKDDPESSLEGGVRCGVVYGVMLRFRSCIVT